MRQIVVIAAAAAVLVACGIAGYLILTDDDEGPATGTYSFTRSGVGPVGELLDEDGNTVVKLSQWKGEEQGFYAGWYENGDRAYVDPPLGLNWCIFLIEFHADPGTTITMDQIYVGVDFGLIVITKPGNISPSDYYVRPYFNSNDQMLHSNLTTTTATTDSNGYAEMRIYALTGSFHDTIYIFGSDTEWTCTNE